MFHADPLGISLIPFVYNQLLSKQNQSVSKVYSGKGFGNDRCTKAMERISGSFSRFPTVKSLKGKDPVQLTPASFFLTLPWFASYTGIQYNRQPTSYNTYLMIRIAVYVCMYIYRYVVSSRRVSLHETVYERHHPSSNFKKEFKS